MQKYCIYIAIGLSIVFMTNIWNVRSPNSIAMLILVGILHEESV